MRDPVQIIILVAAAALLGVWWTNLPEAPVEPLTPSGPVAGDEALPRGAETPTTRPTGVAARPPTESTGPGAQAEAPRAAAIRAVVLENDVLRLRFSNQDGRLESARLLKFKDRLGGDAGSVELVTDTETGTLLLTVDSGTSSETATRTPRVFSVAASSKRSAVFEDTQGGVFERRTLTLDSEGYGAELRVSLENRGQVLVEPKLALNFFGSEREVDAPDYFQNYQLVAASEGDLKRRILRGIGSPSFFRRMIGGGGSAKTKQIERPVAWVGVESQYFLVAAITDSPDRNSSQQIPTGANTGAARLSLEAFPLPPGTKVERLYKLYLGPKIESDIVSVDDALMPAVNVGWKWVRPIVSFFANTLRWSYDNIVANYGVGIILLTILLRLLTYPLTQKSMKSMKRFQEIAPVMKELQEKHGEDRERLQQEMMKLYRDKGVNPFSALGGGCLPMLIQMPFMIALYFALQGSIELRHAPFALWIQDLSAPEDFINLAGFPIRPLPLLMGGSMLLQQRLGPQTGDPQQRQMMMWMSVVFTFMFYRFPSGLLLYWFVSNIIGIAQQLFVNREAKAS